MWDANQYRRLQDLRQHSLQGGGPEKIDKQHRAGKLTARERLDIIFDAGIFVDIGGLIESQNPDLGMAEKKTPGDGVVTGYGKVNGRLVFASSEDFTVIVGTL